MCGGLRGGRVLDCAAPPFWQTACLVATAGRRRPLHLRERFVSQPLRVSSAVAMVVGVLCEALYVGRRAQSVIADLPPTAAQAPLTFRGFLAFYVPLSLTSVLGLLAMPIGAAGPPEWGGEEALGVTVKPARCLADRRRVSVGRLNRCLMVVCGSLNGWKPQPLTRINATTETPATNAITRGLEEFLNERDLEHLSRAGIGRDELVAQIETLRRGTRPVDVQRSCSRGDGVHVVPPGHRERLGEVYRAAQAAGRVMKFVPASGAASRMFAALSAVHARYQSIDARVLERLRNSADEADRAFAQVVDHQERFAFHRRVTALGNGEVSNGRLAPNALLDLLLTDSGLSYRQLPKGMVEFHAYPEGARTALEEHIVEALAYCRDESGCARVHFTVPAASAALVDAHLRRVCRTWSAQGVRLEVGTSTQRTFTDTVAVDLEDRPLRDGFGRLVLRPGGHGALLGNLNDLQGDIVFVKNVDNVVHDHAKPVVTYWKTVLGGFLVTLQGRVHRFLHRIEAGEGGRDFLAELREFTETALGKRLPGGLQGRGDAEQREYFRALLDRPLRVCGVVENAGEAGGGPFWVRDEDGSSALQLVEFAQIDHRSADQRALFAESTHFNPVDLVCAVRDHHGRPFQLSRYADAGAAFVTTKSRNGTVLKALELPGLWNGSMAYWNTLFVEVPRSTFAPVKSVLDLLQPLHQPAAECLEVDP